MNCKLYIFLLISVLFMGCESGPKKPDKHTNLLTDYKPKYADGSINAVIEITAGTVDKWEVGKKTGQLKLETRDGVTRKVKYLGYPANYGMIPQTLLSKENGGDGDPLDVLVLGEPLDRGSVVKCKLIGVLKLLDRGEQDDKLIAVLPDSPFYDCRNLKELNADYNGILDILELWFTHYKGQGKMVSQGYADRQAAEQILDSAIKGYRNK